jgi:hypothetical protein
VVPGWSDPRLLQLGQRALHLNKKDPFVEEQIDEIDIRKIPQNCLGGIREFYCASLFVSLLLASLRNTSSS